MTIVRCLKKVEILALHHWRMHCKHSQVSGSFKFFELASWICKSCWGIASSKSNLLIIFHGALPLFGCSLLTSLSQGGSKFVVILLNRGRWWHAWWPFFHCLAWRILYNFAFGGKLNTKNFTPALPWIGASYFIVKVWMLPRYLEFKKEWFYRVEGSMHQILLYKCFF